MGVNGHGGSGHGFRSVIIMCPLDNHTGFGMPTAGYKTSTFYHLSDIGISCHRFRSSVCQKYLRTFQLCHRVFVIKIGNRFLINVGDYSRVLLIKLLFV